MILNFNLEDFYKINLMTKIKRKYYNVYLYVYFRMDKLNNLI